jgi:hypothetical protein
VGKKRLALQGFNNRGNAIVAANPEIIALGNIVGKHNPGVLADSRKHG